MGKLNEVQKNVKQSSGSNAFMTNVTEDAVEFDSISNKFVFLDPVEAPSLKVNGQEVVPGGSGSQVQADWNQTDIASPAYINNKPTIPSVEGLASQNYVDGAIIAHNNASNAHQYILNEIWSIKGKIPAEATSSNKLADKAFVNSSVATSTGTYISDNGEPFTSVDDLPTTGVKTNDYAFVTGEDSEGNTYYDRYKATVTENELPYDNEEVTWAKEYRLNNSSFTAVQWSAINSGFTSTDKTKLDTISEGAEVNVQSDWNESDSSKDSYIKNKPVLSTVATSGSYNDLSNRPTIPSPQVQSDWGQNVTTAIDYIKNKPTLSTVATSGSYNDLTDRPTIPSAQVQSDWNQTVTTAFDYIKNKPTLSTVATSGSYNDLSDTPSIPEAQIQSDWNQTDSTKADYIKNKPTIASQLEAGDGIIIEENEISVDTEVISSVEYVDANITDTMNFIIQERDSEHAGRVAGDNLLDARITAIEGKIPTEATTTNQLADKAFVNSSIATNTGSYISDDGEPFTSASDLPTTDVNTNDYAFVTGTDTAGNTYYDRYKATLSGSTVTWAKEYRLNNSSFTAVQWGTINSGFTSTDKTKLDGISAGAEVNVQSDWNQSDSTSDDYIKNKPTNVSSFTNDADYQSGNDVSSAISDALEDYTPTSGLATVATSGSYNDLSDTPSIDEVSVSQVLTSGTKIAEITVGETTTELFAPNGGSSVQPDWNQNDSTADDYIKNRTHYSEVTDTTETFSTVPFTYYQFANFINGAITNNALTASTLAPVVGDEYTIKIGSDEFTDVEAESFTVDSYFNNNVRSRLGVTIGDNIIIFGNKRRLNDVNRTTYDDTLETYCVAYYGRKFVVITTQIATVNIELSGKSLVYHKIDKNYLPSDVAMKSELSTVATSGSYNDLSNKPTIPSISGLVAKYTEGYASRQATTYLNNTYVLYDFSYVTSPQINSFQLTGGEGEYVWLYTTGASQTSLTIAEQGSGAYQVKWIDGADITNLEPSTTYIFSVIVIYGLIAIGNFQKLNV